MDLADGGRIGFKDGTQLNNEVLLEYFKKHKGKKYSEIAKILDEDGYITKGGRKVTPEAIEMRAIRGEMTGYGHSKFIETTEDLIKEATPQQLKDYKSGKISEELFRQRVLGKRGDIKRTGTEARKLQSKKYRDEAKLPGFEERAKKIKDARFKFREQEYLKKGMAPPAKNAKEELWRSLFTNGQDYKKGRRLKTLGKYSKYIDRDKLFNAEILDTKTGKKITFKNLEKYINPKNTGKTYAEVIKPYDQKWFINTTPGLRNEINSKLIKDWTPSSKDTFFEIQHNAGKATHPFDVSLANERVNLKEYGVRNKFEKAWDKTKSISERKNLFKNYIKELPKGIVSQPSMVKRTRTFGEEVPFDQQLRALKAEGVKLPRGTLTLIKSLCPKGKASGGRIGYQGGTAVGGTLECGVNELNKQLVNGPDKAKVPLIRKILAGGANVLKQALNPKELLKMENLIGKPALYATAAFETALVADDVLRKNKPLNVAAAESLFGSVLNLDADAARAKNLLESGAQLSPAAQEYAQNILDYDKYRKLNLSFPSSLVAKSMPGSDKYFKMQEDLKNKIESTPDTGAMDYMSALDESEGTFKAKPKYFPGTSLEMDSPDAPEVTPLTNKFAKAPGRRVGPMTAKQDMQIDFSLPTYDRSFTASDDFLNQYLKSIEEKPLRPGEGTLFRMNEPDQRGLFGTQERFAGGGIAGIRRPNAIPPKSGPNPQGLPSMYNRVKRI